MAEIYDGVIYGDYSKYTRLRINYTVSQNETTAVSTITMNLYAERTKGSEQYNNSGQAYWNLTGKGNTSMKFSWAASSLEMHLGSSSTTVQHNPDGTGSVTLSGYWYTGRTGSSYIPEAISISKNITLKTIPRASTVKGGSGNIGEQTTISISRASTSFTHTLRYGFGNLTDTIATGVGDSYKWTIPTSFYTQIPNNTRGHGGIYCDTYAGSTLVGTTLTEITVTVNKETSRPTVTGTVVDTNSTTIALTGNANKLIRGKSTAKITVTPTVKNSATLKSVTIDGVATSDNTRTIANVTKTSFPVVVTDSRGYTNTAYNATASGGMVDYVDLSFNVQFFRPQPTTGEVQLTYSGNFFNGNFGAKQNTVGIEWHYRVKGSDTWIKGGIITPTINGNIIEKKTISLGTTYDYQTAYEFYFYSQDLLTSFSTTASVSVGMPVFNWGKDFFNVNSFTRLKKNLELSGFFAREGQNSKSFLYLLDAMNVSGRYYKLASIPATNDANAIQLNIKGYMGNWTGAKVTIDLQISNRDSLRVYGNYIGHSDAFNCQRIVIYKESDGSHTVYLHNVSGFTGPNAFNITCGSYGGIYATITNDYSYTTAPTGTLAYSSTTSTMGNANGAVILFDNSSGTTGTVTLNETAANFAYLEIFYGTSNSTYNIGKRVCSPNGKICRINWAGSTYSYYKDLQINTTSITNYGYGKTAFKDGAFDNTSDGANTLYIQRVIGWK